VTHFVLDHKIPTPQFENHWARDSSNSFQAQQHNTTVTMAACAIKHVH